MLAIIVQIKNQLNIMKFLLVIQICSIVLQECTQPINIYPLYNSHYDCATAGFIKGISTIRELGEENVNKDKMLINFSCKELANT